MSRSFILFTTAGPSDLVDTLSPCFNHNVEAREEDGRHDIRASWKDGALLISHTEAARDDIHAMTLEEYQDSILYLDSPEFQRFDDMIVNFYHCQIQCEFQPVNRFLLSLCEYALMIDFPILITDTELKAMLRVDIAFDWYRWHQARLADPAVKARYYS
ncbi:MAG TPA: hypothetical protein VIQ53_00490 [Inquilinus sp.]